MYISPARENNFLSAFLSFNSVKTILTLSMIKSNVQIKLTTLVLASSTLVKVVVVSPETRHQR